MEFPIDRAGTWGPMLEDSSPDASAVWRTLSRPVSMPSCMNGVFTDRAMASRRLMSPYDLPPSLCAETFLPLRSQYGPSGVVTGTPSSPS